MERSHSRSYTVRNYEVGPHQAAHLRTLLDYLQETADAHVRERGVSVQELLEKGYLWVLSAYRLEVERYPAAAETVTVRTWYPGRRDRFYLRDFEVLDADGTRLAAAATSWALIDARSKRPAAVGDEVLRHMPVLEERALADDLARIPPGEAPDRGEPFTVPASCLDMYRHVNHVFYIQWAVDSVSPGLEAGLLPRCVEAAFRAEALQGDRLAVTVASTGDDRTFLHSIVREGDGREITRLRTRWRVP